MKIRLIFFFLSLISLNEALLASETVWNKIDLNSIHLESKFKEKIASNNFSIFNLSVDNLKNNLNIKFNYGKSLALQESTILEIPMPDGNFERFKVYEFPIMHPDLSRKFPNIKAYAGIGLDDPSAKIRFDISSSGFHGIITSGENSEVFIDPYAKNKDIYISYKARDYRKEFRPKCFADDEILNDADITDNNGNNRGLKKYRIAIACTGEYSQYHGGTTESVLSAIHTTMTRVNAIFERDASIHLELVANNDEIIFLDAETDPYKFNFPYENQTVCDSIIGSENYDLGHAFGIGEGGSAMRSGCCVDDIKAEAYSTFTQPEGDIFDVNFVAHEIGHQFGCGHTYNGTCNSTLATSIEPGAGSTIMGTDFFCNKIQNVRDAYFHAINLMEIEANLKEGLASSCAEIIETDNNAPTVKVDNDHYFLPISTNFKLTAEGNDIDGDILTYCWEQLDNETNIDPPLPTNSNGPSFRSLSPDENPFRYFPALKFILEGQDSKWEVIPSVCRQMKFRVTVRDNNQLGGKTASDDLSLSFVSNSGPFLLEFPNGEESLYQNGVYSITWDKANTDKAPVSCKKVNILLSVDGGYNYEYILASEVANDGYHIVQMPNIETNNARIMVESSDNVFFDISDEDFNIIEPNQESFNFAISPESQNICPANTSTTFSLQFNRFNNFDELINLSISDLPNEISANFTNDLVLENNSIDLIISNLDKLEVGTYPITIKAQADAIIKENEIQLKVKNNIENDINLISPTNGSKDESTKPIFSWESPSEFGFIIEIASSPDFNNSIIERHFVNSNTFSPNSNLEALSVYYWRVLNQTDCNYSSLNVPFSSFQTSTNNCVEITFNEPLYSHIYIDEASNTFRVEEDIKIDKINVSMQFFHKNVGDLSATLTSPAGSTALLFDRPGYPETPFGCTRDDLLINFDDDSQNSSVAFENTCVRGTDYAIEGSYNSITPLSIFKGENAKGIWSIRIKDDKFQHSGVLDNWSLQFCNSKIFEPTLEFNKEDISVNNLGSEVISDQNLLATSGIISSENIIYTIISPPENGLLSLTGIDLKLSSTFTQEQINNGFLEYKHLNADETKDEFLVDIETKDGDWIPSEKISINGGFSSVEKRKTNSSNIKIYPKVASDYLEISYGNDIGSVEISIYDLSGRLIDSQSLSSNKNRISISEYNPGLYLIIIKNESLIYFDKFLKI